jgi:hypothetical protein
MPAYEQGIENTISVCQPPWETSLNLDIHSRAITIQSHFLSISKILFQEADELYELQKQEWEPILKWFCKHYNVKLEAARDISGPTISQETKDLLTKHLLSYNFWAIHGLFYISLISWKCLKIWTLESNEMMLLIKLVIH